MLLYVFILGLLIGSFLNVCIYRIPKGKTVVTEHSHCMRCGKRIRWFDLVPVISYLLLQGKCRMCKCKISVRYPVIEVLNALVYVMLYRVYDIGILFLGLGFLASTLIVVSFIDVDHKYIPNRIVMLLLGVGVLYNILNKEMTVFDSIVGFFSASVPLLILAMASKGGMGGGDIKLMAVVGIFLGWQFTVLALIIAACSGSVVGIGLMLFKKVNRKEPICFGPFLSVGIGIVMIYGQEILAWYRGVVGI